MRERRQYVSFAGNQAAVRVRYAYDWRSKALHHARELAALAQPKAFEIFSTRRQVVRYLDLYGELGKADLAESVEIAVKVIDLLPEEPPEDTAPGWA